LVLLFFVLFSVCAAVAAAAAAVFVARGADGPCAFAVGLQDGRRATRTVRVRNISDLAGEREVREFFSFSGEIDHVHIRL
jgi:hypothetical protein